MATNETNAINTHTEMTNIPVNRQNMLASNASFVQNISHDEPHSTQPASFCYKVDDLMQMLSIGRDAVYALLKRQVFRSIRIPGVGYRIPKRSFDTWLHDA